MWSSHRSVFALLLVAAGALAAPRPKDQPAKDPTLVGTWDVAGLTAGGSVVEIQGEGLKFEFSTDGSYRRLRADGPTGEAGSFTVDAKPTPPTIELVVTRDGKPFRTYRGIWQVAGDELTLALAPGREEPPTKFESPKGGAVVLWTCKRTKSKK